MKTLKTLVLSAILTFTFTIGAAAIEWVGTNQSTVRWDAVTNGNNDTPIPAEDQMSYRVYVKRHPNGQQVLQGETAELQYTISFSTEGMYVVGVQTVRVPQNSTEELTSDITWSDSTDVVAVPAPFGIVFYERPYAPKGLSQ